MWTIMMSKSVKNPLKRSQSHETPEVQPGTIVIKLYRDADASEADLQIGISEPGNDYTAEKLCHIAGTHLGIGPSAMPLYALLSSDQITWLAPSKVVTCPEQGPISFTFRMRIRPHLDHIERRSFGVEAFNYLFLQVRHDIINDNYPCVLESEKTLGLGVIDIHRYGKERNMSVKSVLNLPKEGFFPLSVKKKLFKALLQDHVLNKGLRKEYSNSAESATIRFQYVNGLIAYVPTYMSETFDLGNGGKIIVDHYHPDHPGVFIEREEQTSPFCHISDIMDISPVPAGNTILINLTGEPPKTLTFQNHAQKLSFIALVDAYRRLTVDYYYHVCSSVESQTLQLLKKYHFHGPVNKDWLETHLWEHHRKTPDVNYLVRQHRRRNDSYILMFIIHTDTGKQVLQLVIEKDANSGKYQVKLQNEPAFNTLVDLLRYYDSEAEKHKTIKLRKRLGPSTLKGDDSGLYLCKPIPKIPEEDEDEPDTKAPKRPQQQHANINLVNNINIIPEPKLGNGEFTETLKGFWNKDQANIQVVAVKQLKAKHTSSGMSYQAFLEAARILSFWKHSTIVPCIAMSLYPLQLLEEYAELGDLESYLQKPQSIIRVHHLVTITEQIAQAILYLDADISATDNRVHGNIRCRNVLVFEHTSQNIKVKLADRGMLRLCLQNSLTHPYNLERLPWVAPELLSDLTRMTPASDRFSFGILLWELFSLGDRPFLHMNFQKVLLLLENNVQLDQPKKCPDRIYTIMQQCWRRNPVDRISALDLVRDIRHVNSAMDPNLRHAEAESHYTNDNLGDLPAQAMDIMSRASEDHLGEDGTRGIIGLLNEGLPPLRFEAAAAGAHIVSQNGGAGFSIHPSTLGTGGLLGGKLNGIPEGTDPNDQPSYAHILKKELLTIDSSKLLGQGYFGYVYRGKYNGRLVAVKTLRKTNLTKDSTREFENEFKLMVKFNHPNIVQIIGQCPGEHGTSSMSLVMEYVEKGCLLRYLRTHSNETGPELLRFASEVAEGMHYLTSQNVIHRDLAARNVLVTNGIRLKISDFGLSRLLGSARNYYKCDKEKEMPVRWCAPESQLYHKFSPKSDVWSYGVTVWEIFSYGAPPKLCEDRNLHTELYSGKRLPMPERCPHTVYTALMLRCWEYYEEQRPDFNQLIASVKVLQQQPLFDAAGNSPAQSASAVSASPSVGSSPGGPTPAPPSVPPPLLVRSPQPNVPTGGS